MYAPISDERVIADRICVEMLQRPHLWPHQTLLALRRNKTANPPSQLDNETRGDMLKRTRDLRKHTPNGTPFALFLDAGITALSDGKPLDDPSGYECAWIHHAKPLRVFVGIMLLAPAFEYFIDYVDPQAILDDGWEVD